MPTYEERLSEVRKRRYAAKPGEARKLVREEEELFAERMKAPGGTYQQEIQREKEARKKFPRSAAEIAELARIEGEPFLTNIPGEIRRGRPTYFIGETPEEVEQAKMAGAERAILGRPSPTITFDKFGEPIIKEPAVTERMITPRGPMPSKKDMDLNEKWEDFRTNYFIPKIGYDPRMINPVQERINAENSIMNQVDINALSVDQYTKLKKESEKQGKQAEELAKEKARIGKDKETQAFELFKIDIYQKAKNQFGELIEEPTQEGNKQTALNELYRVMNAMSTEEKQRYLQQPEVQAYAQKWGIRGQDIEF